jgi:hypothetical protein
MHAGNGRSSYRPKALPPSPLLFPWRVGVGSFSKGIVMTMRKCAACGFLALKDNGTRELCATDKHTRNTSQRQKHYSHQPFCAVNAIEIENEVRDSKPETYLQAINTERPCGWFVQWVPGLKFKEHHEALMHQQAREWQASQDDARRVHEDKREADDRRWQEDRRVSDRRHRRIDIAITAVFSLFVAWLIFYFDIGPRSRDGGQKIAEPTAPIAIPSRTLTPIAPTVVVPTQPKGDAPNG